MYRIKYIFHRKHLFNFYNSFNKPVIQNGVLVYDASIISLTPNRKMQAFNKRYRESVKDEMVENRIATVFELHIYELLRGGQPVSWDQQSNKIEFQKRGNFKVRHYEFYRSISVVQV